MKLNDYRKWQIGDLTLNHGYSRGEVADIFQIHPNQVTVVLRESVEKGYFPEEQRQCWIKQSKINGGKMSPKNDSYSFGAEHLIEDKLNYFDKNFDEKNGNSYKLSMETQLPDYDSPNLLEGAPGDESGSIKSLEAQDRYLLEALKKGQEKTNLYMQ